ncbi:MAG: spore germination protein GerW family protein [Rhodothermales bacterium]|nr:spore germination protein GerW family protein [Rhodothermales bacterium]
MSLQPYYQSFAERLQQSATVKTIYGEPIEAAGRTLIPVARVAYGFGGGPARQDAGGAVTEAAGGGGGVHATPLGVFEVTAAGTRFVRADGWKHVAWLLVGLGAGYLLGRLRGGA